MTHPIRPVKTFVLRLWREPGDQETEAGWRGVIRSLETRDAQAREVTFRGLGSLLAALQPLLTPGGTEEEKMDTS
jgi:hypothetical protein